MYAVQFGGVFFGITKQTLHPLPFPKKHGSLALFSAAVIMNFTVFLDNPVAGNQIGDRIIRHGSGSCAHRLFVSGCSGNLFVGNCFTERDSKQRAPNLFLTIAQLLRF